MLTYTILKLCILGFPKFASEDSDQTVANALANLDLRCTHMSDGTFSDVAAHMCNGRKIILQIFILC